MRHREVDIQGLGTAIVEQAVATSLLTTPADIYRLTAATLARAAHVSERTLYEGFQREFGLAPLTYVRRFRLERAREALIASAPDDGATVAEVAASHGFGHLGRFAASYRERYGESPSETLRR